MTASTIGARAASPPASPRPASAGPQPPPLGRGPDLLMGRSSAARARTAAAAEERKPPAAAWHSSPATRSRTRRPVHTWLTPSRNRLRVGSDSEPRQAAGLAAEILADKTPQTTPV